MTVKVNVKWTTVAAFAVKLTAIRYRSGKKKLCISKLFIIHSKPLYNRVAERAD